MGDYLSRKVEAAGSCCRKLTDGLVAGLVAVAAGPCWILRHFIVSRLKSIRPANTPAAAAIAYLLGNTTKLFLFGVAPRRPRNLAAEQIAHRRHRDDSPAANRLWVTILRFYLS